MPALSCPPTGDASVVLSPGSDWSRNSDTSCHKPRRCGAASGWVMVLGSTVRLAQPRPDPRSHGPCGCDLGCPSLPRSVTGPWQCRSLFHSSCEVLVPWLLISALIKNERKRLNLPAAQGESGTSSGTATRVCGKRLCILLPSFWFFPVNNLIMPRSINLGQHRSVLLKYFTLSPSYYPRRWRELLSIN